MQEMQFPIHGDDNTLHKDDSRIVELLRVVSKCPAALNVVDLLSMRHNLHRVKDAQFAKCQ